MSDLRVNGVIMDRSEWAKHQGYVRGKADVLAKLRDLRDTLVIAKTDADAMWLFRDRFEDGQSAAYSHAIDELDAVMLELAKVD